MFMMSSLFTVLEIGRMHLVARCTKLFIQVSETEPVYLRKYLVLEPSKTFKHSVADLMRFNFLEILTSDSSLTPIVKLLCRPYKFLRVRDNTAPKTIEKITYRFYRNLKTDWSVTCENCAPQKVFDTMISRSDYVGSWHGQPELEMKFLNLLFPNSTFTLDPSLVLVLPTLNIYNGIRPLLYSANKLIHGYFFITCANIVEIGGLSLKGYVSAFDKTTWICLGMSSLTTALILVRVLHRMKLRNSIVLSLFVLLEQGCLGAFPKNFRWVTGVWILAGIVLSNIYKGDNITSLTAPLPSFKLERFEQLLARNFSYFMAPNAMKMQHWKEFMTLKSIARNLNLSIGLNRKTFNFDSVTLHKEYVSTINSQFLTLNNQSRQLVDVISRNMYSPKNLAQYSYFLDPGFFLARLAKCNKQAFIGHFEVIQLMAHTLSKILKPRSQKNTVSMSKDPLSNGTVVWNIYQVRFPASHFFIRYHSLWQSGLVGFWETWNTRIVTRESYIAKAHDDYEAKQPKKLDFEDNVIVVFYLYGLLALVSLLLLWKETRHLVFTCIFQAFSKLSETKDTVVVEDMP